MRLSLILPAMGLALDWESEVRGHLRLDDAAEKGRVESVLIPSAMSWVEAETNRALLTQTWKALLDEFPHGYIEIPKPPLIEVSSVRYVDADGVQQLWDALDYVVEAPAGPHAVPGRLWPAFGKSYPCARCQPDAVEITFRCGYGAAFSNVPAQLRSGMLLIVGELFERREVAIADMTISEVPLAARALVRPFRVGM
jgi:uncharacterized phiE125 gp8 family phage protein